MFMDIVRCLKTFCAVVESGSFSIAAEKMYLTQPSVSTHIRDLEKHYVTILLNRKRDRITPTDTGKLLYEYAKKILKLTRETKDAIDDVNKLIRGEIEIAASTVPGTYILPEILFKFRKEYPGIELSMRIKDTGIVIKEVFDQSVDFGIVGEEMKKPGLIFHKLIDDRVVLIVHPSKKKKRLTLAELKEIPLVFRENSSGTRMVVVEKLTKKGISVNELNIVMELGSTEAVKHGVMAGLGSSFVSERTIKNEESQGLLKKIPIEGLKIDRYFWIVKHSSGNISRAGMALYDFISKECK